MSEQTTETAQPRCRACYAATLSPDERDRFNAEPVTSCIYLCPGHQAALDERLARLNFAFNIGPRDMFPDTPRAFAREACVPDPTECTCECHQPGGVAVSHMVACCDGSS